MPVVGRQDNGGVIRVSPQQNEVTWRYALTGPRGAHEKREDPAREQTQHLFLQRERGQGMLRGGGRGLRGRGRGLQWPRPRPPVRSPDLPAGHVIRPGAAILELRMKRGKAG
jgi:hypothetical protein